MRKTGHPTTECHVAKKNRNKNVEIATNYVKTNQRIKNNNWLPMWEKSNLIHPFYH